MSVEISFGYIVHWDKFEREFTIPLTDLFMRPFWGHGIAEFPKGYESFNVQIGFLECCFNVGRRCSPELKRHLQTVFLWEDRNDDWTQSAHLDLPFHEEFIRADRGDWSWLAFALNPQSVASLCRVADLIVLGECQPFFTPSERIRSFDNFCAYARSWIEHFKEAESINAGVVIFYF